MGKTPEARAEHLIDLGFEVVMLILIGIPTCSLLLAVVVASCLISLPLLVMVTPFLFASYRRHERAMRHPLSDRTLGVVEPVVAAESPPVSVNSVAGFGPKPGLP